MMTAIFVFIKCELGYANDVAAACELVRDFLDTLTNWYIRRSRDRFWEGSDTGAFDTLYTVLETLTRVAAPLIPLVSERVWQGLTGGRSVHLQDWPDAAAYPAAAHDPAPMISSPDPSRFDASLRLSVAPMMDWTCC